MLKDLAATERQVERFSRAGKLDFATYASLKAQIGAEKERLNSRAGATSTGTIPPEPATLDANEQRVSVTQPATADEGPLTPPHPQSVVVGAIVETGDDVVIEPIPSFLAATPGLQQQSPQPSQQESRHTTVDAPAATSRAPYSQPRPPRKSFPELLNAFMEESNIRWGEIIGGLLILGCSTALVVSLWSEISQIPVVKFLIFTTVTAALFGIGLYTEHRWKLPTTSRGILTIAALLVPLNFLAIAAVTGGAESPSALVVGSELLAPAIFLCLVYFAGKVLTPAWPHLLVAGVLGSSLGQLLIRHFASPELPPGLLVALGAFPLACYVGSAVWMLRKALADGEISEDESIAIFITLGALTFAAALPFGLLLYKTGSVGMTMMYLAPLVSFAGFPLLATGMLLWRRVTKKELVATRTVGTSLAIIGTVVVVSGMFLAWPNPASIIPAALFNFAVFTSIAVQLEVPLAHVPAACCFALAYLVLFHVGAGHVAWQNLRATSLLNESLSVRSGQALAPLFVLFIGAAEWLARKRSQAESKSYLAAACATAVVSLGLVTIYGLWFSSEPFSHWLVYATNSLGAFRIAWRNRWKAFSWIGSGLLLAAFAQGFAQILLLPFPWQTAILAHASVCAIAAVICAQYSKGKERIPLKPLNESALISSFIAVLCLVQAGNWETTAMQAERMFWLSGIWLTLLWLNRQRKLFTVFQVALTCAVVLAVKASLQQYDWYAYQPHAFLHPWGLQIQGTTLVLLSIGWVGLRLGLKSETPTADKRQFAVAEEGGTPAASTSLRDKFKFVGHLLDSGWSFDRLVLWLVLAGFVLLATFGALTGVARELTARDVSPVSWDIAGFPHQQVLLLGSWILLALLVIALLANLWERRRSIYLLGVIAALATVCPLLAGSWETQIATASAWRWFAAAFLAMASVPLLYRQRVFVWLQTYGWPQLEISDEELSRRARIALLVVTVAPIVVLTTYPALGTIYYMPVAGPAAGFFSLFGEGFLYGLPLVVVALVLVAYAVRERLPDYAFAAGLFLNLTVTIAHLWSVVEVNGLMNRVVLAQAIQLNALVFGLYALVWLALSRRWAPQLSTIEAEQARQLLKNQGALALGASAIVIIPVAISLIARPEYAGIGTLETGSVRGWLALILSIAAAASYARVYKIPISPRLLFTALLGASCLIAFAFAAPGAGVRSAYHVLLTGAAVIAWLMLLASWIPPWLKSMPDEARPRWLTWFNFADSWAAECLRFATVAGALTVFLSLRRWQDEPFRDWWSIATLLSTTGLFALMNRQTLRRRYIYAAGILFNVAVSIWWGEHLAPQFGYGATAFLEANIVALCLSSVVWLRLELRARTLAGKERSNDFSFHNLAALLSLLTMTVIVMLRLAASAQGYGAPSGYSGLDWLALGSLAVLMIACVWDRYAQYAVAGLYLMGLLAAAMLLEQLNLPPRRLAWAGMISLAIYTVGTALVWRARPKFIAFTDRLRVPRRIDDSVTGLKWLTEFNVALAAVVVLIAYWIDLSFGDWTLRMTAALAVAIQALTLAIMAEGVWRPQWQRAAIAVLVVGLVFFGWGWLVPGVTGTWLNRAVILMVEMFVLTGLYGLGLNKALEREPDWTKAAQACVPWIVGTGLVALLFSLATEVFYQVNFGAVRINPLALVAIGVTLAGAVVISVLFALSPKHDPLNLSERGRMNYVYAGEVMLALLFMHVRLTLPWLFTGFFERYWPIVVMAIAYLGVGTAESLRRRKLLVLAQPIERTGAFLPLLPVLGFWLAQSQVDYSALLFIVGGLYGLLSILRRSFVFGLFAAIAGNGGLWYLLHRSPDYHFLQHPQLWLIPVAISVLIAAYLNEKDFSEEQMAGIRYLSLVTIYVSSTGDIFINGVAESPWLPLVLAALSLGGVFCGIIFRIRGFLLLGSIFLLLAIITMIWYASANLGWTWLWYVAGIVTGATIIFMFAVFEKKRGEVLRLVEGLKEWER